MSRGGRDSYIEHGLTWYTALGRYGITPGHSDTAGVRYPTFDPSAAILRCFACHSTGPLALGTEDQVEPHEPGVRCEACHGPAAAHVRDPARVRPRNPARLLADEINGLCGACHRMPAGPAEATDYASPWNARHQPLLLAESACYRGSRGRLTCFTCHSPHAPLERSLAAYNRACEGCHRAPPHRTAIAGQPCAGCHMPAVAVSEGLRFANHRIGLYTPADPLRPIAPAKASPEGTPQASGDR